MTDGQGSACLSMTSYQKQVCIAASQINSLSAKQHGPARNIDCKLPACSHDWALAFQADVLTGSGVAASRAAPSMTTNGQAHSSWLTRPALPLCA